MLQFLGALLTRLGAWVLSLMSAGECQKKDDQIARDSDEIQSLKDMAKIEGDNASLSGPELLGELYQQTSLRRPLP